MRRENLLEFLWGRHFSYLQAGLDITIKTFISRIINCLVLQTNALIKILKWRHILYHSNLRKSYSIIQFWLRSAKKKKSQKVPKSRASHYPHWGPQRYVFIILPPFLTRECLYQHVLCEKLTLISFFHTQGNTIACKCWQQTLNFLSFCHFQCFVVEK